MSAAATRSYKVSMFMNVEKQSFIIEIQLYRINKLSFFSFDDNFRRNK